ncbi:MAG: glycosyltransferase family A protein, partial [Bacteroidales bacterium]
MNNPFFTIFTSVFNGEDHIHRVFESISIQTFKDFEWIVVNDASTDNTSNLIKSFIRKHPEINISYLEQEKSGKHFAWNKAIKCAKGFFLLPVD